VSSAADKSRFSLTHEIGMKTKEIIKLKFKKNDEPKNPKKNSPRNQSDGPSKVGGIIKFTEYIKRRVNGVTLQ